MNKEAMNVPFPSVCEAGHDSWVSPESEAFPLIFPVFSHYPGGFSQPLQRQSLALCNNPLLLLSLPQLQSGSLACHHRSGDAAHARQSTEE